MRLRDVFSGRWVKSAEKQPRRGRKALLYFSSFCVCFALGGYFVGVDNLAGKELHAVNVAEAAVIPVVMPSKVDEMKRDVLDRLSKCESGGLASETGIDTIDTNNKVSYGVFQFQKATVQYYWQKMTGEKISGKEAILIALDDVKARELASWIIFETDAGSAKDWVRCSHRDDLTTLVEFIKAHE